MGRYSVFLSVLIAMSCVQIKQQTLYDGVEPAPPSVKPKDIDLVVEPVVFDDNPKDMWGIEKDVCKNVQLSTDVAYNSNTSIKMTWDRNAKGCDWAGIGIGWDGYAGKDLTEIMEYAAFEFYVRSIEGKSFGLPIVLTLEDYSGGMGFCYTSNKYFERTTIDEEWQKVTVPLADFDLETENLDITNIKQLQLEFQQSGSVYLDNIRLVFYEPEPVEPWMEEEELPDPALFPINIFTDAFINDNSFGVIDLDCQNFKIEQGSGRSGSAALNLKWDDSQKCDEIAFGASWNKWHPVDLSKVKSNAAIQFDLKNMSDNQPLLFFGFEDYDRARNKIKIEASMGGKERFSKDWSTYTVPLNDIGGTTDYSRIKLLYFGMLGKGEVLMDNIRLVDTPQ
jgi:hypothetical protein